MMDELRLQKGEVCGRLAPTGTGDEPTAVDAARIRLWRKDFHIAHCQHVEFGYRLGGVPSSRAGARPAGRSGRAGDRQPVDADGDPVSGRWSGGRTKFRASRRSPGADTASRGRRGSISSQRLPRSVLVDRNAPGGRTQTANASREARNHPQPSLALTDELTGLWQSPTSSRI